MLMQLRIGLVLFLIAVSGPCRPRLPILCLWKISPDGRAVAMISPKDGRQGVRVWHADGVVDYYMPAGDDQINWVSWKGNDRVLMSLRATETEPGAANRPIGVSRLVFVDLASHLSTRVAFREPVELGHIIYIGRGAFHPPNVQDRVISLLPADPGHILLSAAADDWAHANALLVDVRDGSPILAMRSSDNVVKW